MLDTLRRGAQTWVAKLLMAILVVSFGAWGIADVFRNFSVHAVASVGDTDIEATEFQRVYQRQIQNFSRQMGQAVSAETAMAFGLPQRILGQLMADAALLDAARGYGIGLSDDALAKAIADDPVLRPQGATAFDRAYFQQLLQQNGFSEASYVAQRRGDELRKQLLDGVVGDVTAPAALIEAVARYRNEVRIVETATLPRSAVTPVPEPTDDDLAKWYDTNKATFAAPEIRTLSIVSATPDALADPAAVSDEEARREYERTKASFGTPETRRIQQVLLPTIEDAEAAAAKIAAGGSFDQLIAERGLKPEDVDLGVMTKAQVIDPAVAEAAFALPPNQVSQPIGATFGGALIRVTEITPEHIRPYEEVAAEIKRTIATRLAEKQILDLHDEIEDARAGGATIREIAERFKLKLVTAEVDAQGARADGTEVADLPEKQALLQAAFAADEGGETDPVPSGKGFVWYSVDKVAPAHDRPLADVRDKAAAAWTDAKVDELLAAKADAMVEAVKAGGDFAQLAADAGATVATSDAFARNAPKPELGPAGVDAAFGGPAGHVVAVEGPDRNRIVMRVKNAVVPPFFAEAADSVDAARQLRTELESSLEAQYVEALKKKLGTTVNQALLDSVIGLGSR